MDSLEQQTGIRAFDAAAAMTETLPLVLMFLARTWPNAAHRMATKLMADLDQVHAATRADD